MEWLIHNVKEEKTEHGWRVSADVAGTTVWVESENLPLAPAAEAFASPFVLAAMYRGCTIRVEAPVSAAWLSHMEQLAYYYSRSWNLPFRMPLVCPKVRKDNVPAAARERALFFSGGADAFYSLMTFPRRIDVLLMVQGFDIPLDDHVRMDGCRDMLQAVSRAVGARWAIMRTNLHAHPCLKGVPPYVGTPIWMASLGHLAGEVVSEFIMSSSVSFDTRDPKKEEWHEIPLLSTERTRWLWYGYHATRSQKLVTLAKQYPIVREYLRVCWKNLAPRDNCSACEKCVRNMKVLESVNELQNFGRVFDLSVPLAERIEALRLRRAFLFVIWRRIIALNLPDDVKKAIRRMMWRSALLYCLKPHRGTFGKI